MCPLEKEPHHLSPLATAASNRGVVGKEEYFVAPLNEVSSSRPSGAFLDTAMIYVSRISVSPL